MKVLLICPPDYSLAGDWYHYNVSPPLGLAYVAAVLENAGHKVEVLDCVIEKWRQKIRIGDYYHIGLSWDEIKSRIKQIKPDLVGITCPFSYQFQSVQNTARLVKEIDSSIPVVTGGAHPTAVPSQIMNDQNFDYVIIGEGEYSMLSLVKCLEKGISPAQLDGLAFRENGNVRVNPKKGFIKDLDELPFPARHIFLMKEYMSLSKDASKRGEVAKRVPYTTMMTSRGCPNRCVFCAIHRIWGRQWRARSPTNVVDEIEFLNYEYGIREIHFMDDNLTLDRKRMEKISQEIVNRGVDITWTTPNGVHVNALNKELLQKMKSSGCYRLFLGIESGNPYILNEVIKKNLSLDRVKKVVKLIKQQDMDVTGFFVLGMPGETKETINDTIELAKSLDLDDAIFSMATPYPGTELYDQSKLMGYLENEDPLRLKIWHANISTNLLSSAELTELCSHAVWEFNKHRILKHPSRIFRKRQLTKIFRFLFKKFRRF